MLKNVAWIILSLIAFRANANSLAFSPFDEQVIQRKWYMLSYNNQYEVANWVAYILDHKKLQNCVQRADNFRVDPMITAGSASPEDYRGSGFDRGHLVPAGDMKFEAEAMSDTFFMSNMTPQAPKYNQGMWAKLENLVRAWAYKYKKIYIVTGPILRGNMPAIGRINKVAVPPAFFKVIVRQEANGAWKGIGILMDTALPYTTLDAYTVSIDTIEDLTATDFFNFLPDNVEPSVERDVRLSDWDFGAIAQYLPCGA